jgi:HK97 family phage portal protein
MANALTRVANNLLAKATGWSLQPVAEGQPHGAPYYLPVTGGWLGSWGRFSNWWQMGHDPIGFGGRSAMIEACVSAYSQTVAMCPGDHWRANKKNGRDRVTNSALARILRYPNDYQSISDFLLNATRDLYMTGNAYCYAPRNDRFEIDELHLMNPLACRGMVAEDGSIFYELAGNWIVDRRYGPLFRVPLRDVLHIKLHKGRREDPLRGETPLLAAALDAAAGDAIKQQQIQFYMNQAKPGMVLSTELNLDKDQVTALRDRWNEQTQGENAGGTPILTNNLKPVAIPMVSGKDAQLAEFMKMSREDIALAFRIPLALLGIGGATAGATEALMREWVSTGLGFCLNHIEEAIGLTFALDGQPAEYVEFDTDALLRAAFKERIEALARAVQGGIFAPNEARNMEGFDDVAYGDEPRVQQQVVPLSAAAGIPAARPPGSSTIIPSMPPAPGAPPQPPQPGATRSLDHDVGRLFARDARKRISAKHLRLGA